MLKTLDSKNEIERFLNETEKHTILDPDLVLTVSEILSAVRQQGDQALKDYTRKFDHLDLDCIEADSKELEAQAAKADLYFQKALKEAYENIEAFHAHQRQQGYEIKLGEEIILGQRVLPLESVGIYVPGGRAQYPSTVLMNAIPARLAGVKTILMASPAGKDGLIAPNLAFAAGLCGIDHVYKLGGAQAIAALAYGSESVQKADKIVGPGNQFVAMAKRLVYGLVDIDMIAGPSEVLIIADQSAHPAYIAADLIAQAEHDPKARPLLITTEPSLIGAVNAELEKQIETLPKKEIVKQALTNQGAAFLVEDLNQAIALANQIAPEHLELQFDKAQDYLDLLSNAGSIFIGPYSCESLGDYYAGVNHVLPTSGTARFASGLNVDSFIKRSTYLHYGKDDLLKAQKAITKLAREEELEGHARAIEVRNG